MPRKTKEINEEKDIKRQSKLNEKINALIKNVLDSDEKAVSSKKAPKKAEKSATKITVKTNASPKNEEEKIAKKRSKVTATAEVNEATTKKSTKKPSKSEEKEDSKTVKKSATKKASTKKSAKDKEDSTTKKTSKANKSTPEKTTDAKSSTKSKTSTSKATTKSAKIDSPTVVEYYDLPYRYNQTVVKVLYQNATTLFVYWEISDNDIENYKKIYGENFFETTRPVLVVYNDTMNYHFEVDINDFANSWYFHINDSKCNYRVELIRRPVFYNEKIKTDYVHISSSNKIESPNDRILFSTDEPYTVYFRNTKNNKQRKVNLPKLLEQLNLTNKEFGFPIVRSVYDLYKNIYHVEDVGEFSVSLTNPSSGNPSSHSLSSRSF